MTKKKKQEPSSKGLESFINPATLALISQHLDKLPYIQALNKKLISIDEQFSGVSQKISSLNGAVESLGSSIVKILDALKIGQPLAETPTPATPPTPVAPNPASTAPPVVEQPPAGGQAVVAESSKGDKLLAWGQILSELAKHGGGPAPPSSAAEEGVAKGIELGMNTMSSSMKVMADILKTLLGVVKPTVGGSSKKGEAHVEE